MMSEVLTVMKSTSIDASLFESVQRITLSRDAEMRKCQKT